MVMIDSKSLILKYRPNKWDEVIGQKEVVRSLKQIVEKKSSHAFLLTGPSGTGKTTLSRIIAQSVGCTGNGDISEIDAATFTGIDDMRSITVGLRYRPFGKNSVKAIIVDEAHALSRQAWQSLLKSVEEPPSWAYWFFCTTDIGRIPDTIKTRCSTYQLKPVSINDLSELLVGIAETEQFKVSDDVIDVCVKEAQGSPRQAISNLATCADVVDRIEGARLLKSALTGQGEAIDLARMLVKGANWTQLLPILNKIKDQNAESIRQVVRAYVTTALLENKNDESVVSGMVILEHFSTPFINTNDGVSPILLAVGRIIFS
jgi:DNA polymerase III gamma/tau subunit